MLPTNKLVVFTFHQASERFDPQYNGKYIWSQIGLLEKQFLYLQQNFNVIRLSEAIDKLKTGQIKKTTVCITFDDGDRTVAEYIVPMMEKHGIPATFFINSAYLDNNGPGYWFNIYNYFANGDQQQKEVAEKVSNSYSLLRNTMDPETYREHRGIVEEIARWMSEDVHFYVSRNFLASLNPGYFEIGLHGHEHQRFSMLTEEEQRANLVKNIEQLSGLEQFRPIFALPFGKPSDLNETTRKIVRELDLELVLSDGGINRNHDSEIKRIPADGRDLSGVFKYLYHFAK